MSQTDIINNSPYLQKGTLAMNDFILQNLSLEHTLARELFFKTGYAHEVLFSLKEYILKLGPHLDKSVYEETSEGIWIAKNASVSASAYICAPCIIGENTEIRHCAFIRGSVIIGNCCVIGNSTEIKNSIIFDGVQIPHYNYVGDSILGYGAHLGAGAITSNLKSDKTGISICYGIEKIKTGRNKLGAIVSDRVEIGCNSVLNPGTVIGKNSRIYPVSSVRGYVPPDSIYKSDNDISFIR